MTEDLGAREREVLKARRESLGRLRAGGVEPFALRFDVDATASGIRERYPDVPPDQLLEPRYSIAGRVVRKRDIGKLKFLVLRDRSGDLQIVADQVHTDPASWSLLEDVDLGDIVGASGRVGTTRKGELSIFLERLTMLTKALRPLPEKWHGLKDRDLQQRKRHLQLATDLDSRDRVIAARAGVLRAFRRYFDRHGFIEVETPLLHPQAGGALAKPFVTHHGVLDVDLYLRIAIELYLKRLLVGGLERVYEIGRNFRNEGIDRTHNPEFTMMEVYQAYTDYEGMMAMVEDLVRDAATEVKGASRFAFDGRELDVGPPWRRITMLGSLSEALGEEVTLERPDLPELAERHDVGVDPSWGPGKVVQELWERVVEPTLFEPTFVCDFPREVSPLARPNRRDPALTEHVDPYLAGIEIGTAYSELTDPDDQRARFLAQDEARRHGDEQAMPLDEDFLEALEHGMPPAGGLGIGIDRLAMILADVPSIRDVIAFPHHRPDGG
jgi:lysyl-tRNA synthetase class 2